MLIFCYSSVSRSAVLLVYDSLMSMTVAAGLFFFFLVFVRFLLGFGLLFCCFFGSWSSGISETCNCVCAACVFCCVSYTYAP